MMYTKHFYGFEKECSSVAYREGKAITGHYFSYRYPVIEKLLTSRLQKALNLPVNDVKFLLPRSEEDIQAEKQEKIDLEVRIAAMDAREKRRYEAEQRHLERKKEDLEQERVVRE